MMSQGLRPAARTAHYSDAVVRRTLAQLDAWLNWLQTNNVKGFMGEVGWPCYPDVAHTQWSNVASAYFDHIRRYDVPIATWAADGKQRPSTFALLQYGRAENNNVQGLAFSTTATNVPMAHAKFGVFTNYHSQYISSPTLLDGTLFSNVNPGTVGTSNADCIYPSNADLAYLAARGVKVIRMSFRWERVYPTLGGALNSTELGYLQTAVSNAAAHGIKVILCPFSFCSYWLGTDATTRNEYKLTTDTAAPVHINHFVDLWTRMSTAFKNNVGIYAYDLINEPYNMGAITGPYGPNLLTNGGLESGISGWGNSANTTIAQSSAQAHAGTYSLSMTAVGSGSVTGWTPSINGITPGQDYYAEAYVRAGTTPRQCRIQIDWKNSSGTILSSTSGAPTTSTTSGWTKITVGGTAPANTNRLNIDVIVASATAGEVQYADDFVFQTSANVSPEDQWEQISQAALSAIRANSDNTLIMVPGYNHSTVKTWATYHPTPWITDPADNFRYEAHHYWNTYGDGSTVVSWAQEITDAINAGY